MARILLVRHAPIPETGVRLTGRIPGISLAEEGLEAAGATADTLAELEIAAVYSSPIDRTIETARILAHPHQLSPILEPGITEIDFGAWTGQTLEELRRTDLWETVQRRPSQVRFPDGESFAGAQMRAVKAIERIAREHADGIAVAVSHSDVIKLVLSRFLGQPLDHFQRLRISTASISDLRFDEDGSPVVVSINAMEAAR